MDAPAIVETAQLRPLTPYGATKAAAEMLMSAYTASYGLRCACLRLTNVYGPGMQAKDSIVARLMRAIRLGRTFEIYGDGRQVRDYVHVSDVIAAVKLGLDHEDWKGPTVIGSGTSLSVLEVVDAVREVTGAEFTVEHGPARPGEMPAVIVDPSRRSRRRLVAAVRLRVRAARRVEGVVGGGPRRDRRGSPGGTGECGRWPMTTIHGSQGVRSGAGERGALELAPDELDRLAPEERSAAMAFLATHPPGLGAPLAVVIPAYNEEPTVAGVVAEIPREAAGLKLEVIVVVDGARDATASKAAGRRRARVRRPRQPRPGRGAQARLLARARPRRER